jgi:asparagine synthase (glutamine-hydrolysing)
MCGIAGFLSNQRAENDRLTLQCMMDVIRHRGPDDGGDYHDAHVSLGHRRLSIVDLATGHQPMANESRDRWIIFNGEIFNHAALRPALEQAGHRYASHSDTETILHAYEEYGERCVERLRGMFAFALWDRDKRELFCARDRLGIKPFYYYWDGRCFVFASEIKALLKHPAVSCRFEDSLLPEHLAFGFSSDDRTLFAGIRKLMPGHILRLKLEDAGITMEIRRYWDIPDPEARKAPVDDEESWIGECRARVEETVRMRLMSDVPLGMFLSGGVDSSVIAALMTRMVDRPVQTFAVGYREAAYSELGYASRVARAIGTDHHEVSVGMEEFFNALPRLIWHEDEPITWPSSVSLYFVSRLAARHVKVVLTGEGSDEIFGGYDRYRHYLLNQRLAGTYGLLPSFFRRWIQRRVNASDLLPASVRRKLRHTVVGRGSDFESLQLDNFYCAFSGEEQAGLLRPGRHWASPYENYLLRYGERPATSDLSRMLYADMKTYLVELLMKQDQMSMACSIESRVPFLDHPLVEFAAGVPDGLKIRAGTGKYIFKKAAADLLPPDIIYRKKMGFPTPLHEWLRDSRAAPLVTRLKAPNGLLREYLDMGAVDRLLDRHARGLEDATDRIWRLLNLQLWGDIFLSGQAGNRMEEPLLKAGAIQ